MPHILEWNQVYTCKYANFNYVGHWQFGSDVITQERKDVWQGVISQPLSEPELPPLPPTSSDRLFVPGIYNLTNCITWFYIQVLKHLLLGAQQSVYVRFYAHLGRSLANVAMEGHPFGWELGKNKKKAAFCFVITTNFVLIQLWYLDQLKVNWY